MASTINHTSISNYISCRPDYSNGPAYCNHKIEQLDNALTEERVLLRVLDFPDPQFDLADALQL